MNFSARADRGEHALGRARIEPEPFLGREQAAQLALGLEAAAIEDGDAVAEPLDLVDRWLDIRMLIPGSSRGSSRAGEARAFRADRARSPAHRATQLGPADQRRGDAQALFHAEREMGDLPVRRRGEADPRQQAGVAAGTPEVRASISKVPAGSGKGRKRRFRSGRRGAGGSPRPARRTAGPPRIGEDSPASMRINVLLPAPLARAARRCRRAEWPATDRRAPGRRRGRGRSALKPH